MSGSSAVEDKLAIRELVESYSDAVARNDAEAWGANWAQNAHWAMPGVERNGKADIVALWKDAMKGYPLVIQYLTCGGIQTSGNTATGSWYLFETATQTDEKEIFVSGRYDDTYEKGSDGRWLFASRKYSVLKVRGAGV